MNGMDILSQTDFLSTLGWMFAIAIIVGGILDNRGRDLITWATAVILFAVMQLVASLTIMLDYPEVHLEHVLLFTFIVLTDYLSGLTVGWGITVLAKRYIQYQKRCK
jgi:hypothetical protein